MKNARIPVARSARKPSTTMTAIAQCGNEEPALSCTLPEPEPPAVLVADGFAPEPEVPEPPSPPPARDDADAAAAEAEDREAAAAEDADAADAEDAAAAAEVDDMDARTESAKVVSGGW